MCGRRMPQRPDPDDALPEGRIPEAPSRPLRSRALPDVPLIAALDTGGGIEYHFQYQPMIVCICKGLSETAIQNVVERGACSVEAVGDACGAGTDCGTCQGSIELLIGELITESRLAETGRQLRALRAPSASAQPEAVHEGQRPGT